MHLINRLVNKKFYDGFLFKTWNVVTNPPCTTLNPIPTLKTFLHLPPPPA